MRACFDDDLPAARHRIASVQGEVHQRRIQLGGIDIGRGQIVVAMDLQPDAFAEGALEHQFEVAKQCRGIDGVRHESLPTRERQ
ncbi:hypothetical protein D3C71_2096390 [compost metagenome]